jgi:hypothetical protein
VGVRVCGCVGGSTASTVIANWQSCVRRCTRLPWNRFLSVISASSLNHLAYGKRRDSLPCHLWHLVWLAVDCWPIEVSDNSC